MIDKVLNIIKNGTIIVTRLLINNYRNLKINDFELILLIYLLNEKVLSYNPKKISSDLNVTLEEVLIAMDSLSSNDIIKVDIKKINNIREEVINLDSLYNKLGFLIVNEEVSSEVKSSNIYDIFEQEFARTLSPMEYQIINGWLEDKMSEEVIISALKEAIYNGVSNLRYIDKILYEWKKKGLTTKELVEKNKTDFVSKKEEKKELFDYNWLDDNEE